MLSGCSVKRLKLTDGVRHFAKGIRPDREQQGNPLRVCMRRQELAEGRSLEVSRITVPIESLMII
jgi:hypothetical protein